MAAIEPSKLSPNEINGLCCVYSALILHDAKMEVNVYLLIYADLGSKPQQAHQSQRQ